MSCEGDRGDRNQGLKEMGLLITKTVHTLQLCILMENVVTMRKVRRGIKTALEKIKFI